jgi:hypothetical protein
LLMPADPIHPDQRHGDQQFRADLVAYLDSLPIGELAELLGELPRNRQQRLQLGVLMIALNERLPDAYKLLPPAGHPGAPAIQGCLLWPDARVGGVVSLALLAVGCRVDHRRNQGRLEPGTAAAPAVHAELPPGG